MLEPWWGGATLRNGGRPRAARRQVQYRAQPGGRGQRGQHCHHCRRFLWSDCDLTGRGGSQVSVLLCGHLCLMNACNPVGWTGLFIMAPLLSLLGLLWLLSCHCRACYGSTPVTVRPAVAPLLSLSGLLWLLSCHCQACYGSSPVTVRPVMAPLLSLSGLLWLLSCHC